MGREVRRVPPDWKHPTDSRGRLQPMFNDSYENKLAEWTEGKRRWDSGEDPDRAANPKDDGSFFTFEEWNGDTPDVDYYRPNWPDETRTAFQVYETVSEGTPVSPVFATKDELVFWLMNDGSGMGIGGVRMPLSRAQAERFADSGHALSMVADSSGVRSGLQK